MTRILSAVVLAPITLALVVGCASKPTRGLIGPRVTLSPSSDHPGVGVAKTHVYPQDHYFRFVVDDVELIPAEGAILEPEPTARFTGDLRRQLVMRLANDYEIVGLPGSGVLRLQTAVVGAGAISRQGLSRAALQVVVSDSATGQAVFAMQDERTIANLIDPSLDEGQTAPLGFAREWAKMVRAQLRLMTTGHEAVQGGVAARR